MSRFDPGKGRSVMDFLYAIAWRNLRDRLQSESFRVDRHRRWAREQPVAVEPQFAVPAPAFDVWAAIVAVTKDSAERRAAEVWLDGGSSDEIAGALGSGHLTCQIAVARPSSSRIG